VLSTVCLQLKNRKVHVAVTHNIIVILSKLKDFSSNLKVTGSQVHCINGSISETLQDRDVVATNH